MKNQIYKILSCITIILLQSCMGENQGNFDSTQGFNDTLVVTLDTVGNGIFPKAKKYDSNGNVVREFGVDPWMTQYLTVNKYRDGKLILQTLYTFGEKKIDEEWLEKKSLFDLSFDERKGNLDKKIRSEYYPNGQKQTTEIEQFNHSSNGFNCDNYKFVEKYNSEGKRMKNFTLCNSDTIGISEFFKQNDACFFESWEIYNNPVAAKNDTLFNNGKIKCP